MASDKRKSAPRPIAKAPTRTGAHSFWATEQVPLLAALGPDPRSWPAGSRAALPPAATLGPGGDALAPAS